MAPKARPTQKDRRRSSREDLKIPVDYSAVDAFFSEFTTNVNEGGMFIATLVGYVLQWTGSYVVPFAIAGGAYLVAMAVIQALAPRLDPPEDLATPSAG